MEKILVTGGAGFIGSNITNQLIDRGYGVLVYDNLSRGFKKLINPNAKLLISSLNEREKLRKALCDIDVVIHTAGFAIVPESVDKPDLYYENNVTGSKILLEEMINGKVNKIVFSSSACVYGNPDKLPLTEESPIKATNPYGQTKIEIERLIQKYNREEGLEGVILRYFNPYGPNEIHDPETHVVPNFVRAALLKKPIPLYWKGEQIRDFIYVEDLASAHIDTLNIRGLNIFNVGTGHGVKVIDLIQKIFEIVGYEVPIKDLGERNGDVPSLYTSAEKIKREVGWEAKTNLDEGLSKTINWFKNYLKT